MTGQEDAMNDEQERLLREVAALGGGEVHIFIPPDGPVQTGIRYRHHDHRHPNRPRVPEIKCAGESVSEAIDRLIEGVAAALDDDAEYRAAAVDDVKAEAEEARTVANRFRAMTHEGSA